MIRCKNRFLVYLLTSCSVPSCCDYLVLIIIKVPPKAITLATRMATFGQVGAFIEGQEEWKQYVERLEQYLIANGVESAQKKTCDFPFYYWSKSL